MDYPFLAHVFQTLGDIFGCFQFLPLSFDEILDDQSYTFLSSSNRVPPSRYSSTLISYFLEIYRLSMPTMNLFLRHLSILV